MNILLEISICDKVDPDDMFDFLKEIINELDGDCEVKVVRGKVIK